MISVIIPLYNKKKTIKKTIESILGQSYKDWEIIIVDDGSTDGSPDVIPESQSDILDLIAKGKIKIISGLGHFGGNWARNYGAHLAQGEYLFFCDADIVLRSDALKKMKNALDKNLDMSYAYGSFRRGWKKMPSRPFNAEQLKKCNYISTMSLIRRVDFPGFDESLKKFQDWDLWLTMLARGKTGIFVENPERSRRVPEILFRSYVDKKGISRWLPKIFYKLTWLKEVKKYNEAVRIIKEKHKL